MLHTTSLVLLLSVVPAHPSMVSYSSYAQSSLHINKISKHFVVRLIASLHQAGTYEPLQRTPRAHSLTMGTICDRL